MGAAIDSVGEFEGVGVGTSFLHLSASSNASLSDCICLSISLCKERELSDAPTCPTILGLGETTFDVGTIVAVELSDETEQILASISIFGTPLTKEPSSTEVLDSWVFPSATPCAIIVPQEDGWYPGVGSLSRTA